MIAVPAGMRVLVATRPIDFRKGADGLVALVSETLGDDPFSGTVFVFRSKRPDRVKILVWDGSGLALYWKRLEQGAFRWPPVTVVNKQGGPSKRVGNRPRRHGRRLRERQHSERCEHFGFVSSKEARPATETTRRAWISLFRRSRRRLCRTPELGRDGRANEINRG